MVSGTAIRGSKLPLGSKFKICLSGRSGRIESEGFEIAPAGKDSPAKKEKKLPVMIKSLPLNTLTQRKKSPRMTITESSYASWTKSQDI